MLLQFPGGIAQVLQTPVQAVLQQYPSTQFPEVHWQAPVQVRES